MLYGILQCPKYLYDKEKIIENPTVSKKIYEEKIKGKSVHIIHQPKILWGIDAS